MVVVFNFSLIKVREFKVSLCGLKYLLFMLIFYAEAMLRYTMFYVMTSSVVCLISGCFQGYVTMLKVILDFFYFVFYVVMLYVSCCNLVFNIYLMCFMMVFYMFMKYICLFLGFIWFLSLMKDLNNMFYYI